MTEFSMDFDDSQVTLWEKYRDGNVKQQFRVPIDRVEGLIASLDGALHHLDVHPHHGHDHRHDETDAEDDTRNAETERTLAYLREHPEFGQRVVVEPLGPINPADGELPDEH